MMQAAAVAALSADPRRAAWRLHMPGGVWGLSTSLAVVAAALHISVVADVAPPASPVLIPWPVFAVAFLLAETYVAHVELERDAHSFTLSEIPLVIGLFVMAPPDLILAQIVGTGLALIRRRQPIRKLAFNVANRWLSACACVTIFAAIAGPGIAGRPLSWLAAFVAAGCATLLETVAILAVMTVSAGASSHTAWPRHTLIALAATETNTSLALAAAAVLWADARAALLLVPPAVVLTLAYRAYKLQLDKNLSLEHLYHSSRVLLHSVELAPAAEHVLTQSMKLFRAGAASLLLIQDGDEEPSALEVAADGGPAPTWTNCAPRSVREIARALGSEPLLVSNSSLLEDVVSTSLRQRDMADAILAPLHGDQGVFGILMVGSRLGDVERFRAEDLKLLETFANQASVSLENARLVDRLRTEIASKEHQSLHDSLTGLPNRLLLHDRVAHALSAANRDSSGTVVMLMDLDRFKEVNDALGHHKGDLLLQEVARRLSDAIRAGDTVARLGGDEFALLLPHINNEEAAGIAAEKVLARITDPYVLDGVQIEVGGSIGIAMAPRDGDNAIALLKKADVAMYLAKEARTGWEIYQSARDTNSTARLELAAELRSAIENERLFVCYQPKADLDGGRVRSVEALVRWERVDGSVVAPDRFIPLAEQTGLIKPLTLHVLRTALRQCRRWEQMGMRLNVAVNLSVKSLIDIDLPTEIETLLREEAVAADRLTLEITESSSLSDSPRAIEIVERLSKLGVSLSIDDFGTGYSSLGYLKRLPFKELKIDKSFVRDMAEDDNNYAIVRSTIDLGRNLGLRVVAEGVETSEVWSRLSLLGCDVGQGYFVSRPLPAAHVASWIKAYGSGVFDPELVQQFA